MEGWIMNGCRDGQMEGGMDAEMDNGWMQDG